LRSHHKLQHELGLVWHRQAELEESIRIKNVRRHAVESGFVVTPIVQFTLGECPLCLEVMADPKIFRSFDLCQRYTCCGAAYCNACAAQYGGRSIASCEAFREALLAGNMGEAYARQGEYAVLNRCPFCRALVPDDEEERYRMAMVHAEAGRVWAQTYIGLKLYSGKGVSKDVDASVRWFTMAAAQGDLDSMSILAQAYVDGAFGVPKSTNKAWELAWPAARLGSAPAQATCAEISAHRGNMAESLQWYTLSAAQGFHAAQHELGRLFYEGTGTLVSLSPFKAHHWFRKAGVQRYPAAQWYMSNLVLNVARIVHGSDEAEGYSPWPESCVWLTEFYENMDRSCTPGTKVIRERGIVQTRCAHCHLREGPTAKITRCEECQTIGYCSETCREIHWNKGHKTDCNRAKELRQSLCCKEL
jgi:MYND finger/Sel1 repeat